MPATRYRNLVTLALLLAATGAGAAEWTIDPTVQLKAGYDDNIRSTAHDKIDSSEITLIPSATFGVETPRSGLNGTVGFTFRRFPNVTGLDDNNWRFGINSFYRTARSEFGLGASVIQDTTLDTQLEETGLVFDRSNRLSKSIDPSWTWILNERTRLRAGYDYGTINYEKSRAGLADYFTHSGQLSLLRAFSEQVVGSISLAHSVTDSDSDIRSSNTNLQGGLSWQFSETFSASLAGGGRYSITKFPERIPLFSGPLFLGYIDTGKKTQDSSSGLVFDASLDKRFERSGLSLSASRNVNNTVSGIQIEVTRLGVSASHNFSERVSGNGGLSWYKSQSAGKTSSGSLDRRYLSGTAQLNWKLAEFWTLSAIYTYSQQQFESTADDAIRNTAYLTLTYRWPRIAVSR